MLKKMEPLFLGECFCALSAPYCDFTVSLAEFAAHRRQRNWDHFLPGRVPGRKYLLGCKCGICSPAANKLCARQPAKPCQKAPQGIFDRLRVSRNATPFQSAMVAKLHGGSVSLYDIMSDSGEEKCKRLQKSFSKLP